MDTGELESLLRELSDRIVAGLTRGVTQSGIVDRFSEILHSLSERVAELEKEVATLRRTQPGTADEAAAPERRQPLGLPMGFKEELANRANRPMAPRPAPVIRRNRNPIRPTVVYRTDPRAVSKPPTADTDEQSKTCTEPGCDRPVRARGLCALHYQRVRYRERKIEHKAESTGPLPPPPPSRQSTKRKHDSGGTRGIFALLYEEKGRRILAGLINQIKFDRGDLVKRLNETHAGMPGVPLEEEDALRAVHYHKLGDTLRKREGEILCRHLDKQKGSLAKTAQKMRLDIDQLKARIGELDLDDEVARIRNQFREEIMEQGSFRTRLDLALTKEKYLADLNILDEVDNSLQRELRAELGKLGDCDEAHAEQQIRDTLDLDEQRYRRLIRRYCPEGSVLGLVAEQRA
ncbi:MAG: hypothetical protein JXR96_07335 [Deltaproteobacteria bacterium]|nr:hypothetical protein [Deltaproteobacteria bacterium]